jgi:hypothetical protein
MDAKYKDVKIDYDVVHAVAGHEEKRNVAIVEAAQDLFEKSKEKAMQVSVAGHFIHFDTVEQLVGRLGEAAENQERIGVYDQNHGG